MKLGDFTTLADDYAKYRPNYSDSVINAILGLFQKPNKDIVSADVGAGTGIWTRQIAKKGLIVSAVEPNDAMRTAGMRDSLENISWKEGSGESTNLDSNYFDWVTMASSFHWVDFDKGTQEFSRILKKGGRFTAIWNARFLESNPLFLEIDEKLKSLVPNINKVSSGSAVSTEELMKRLFECNLFADPIYIEGYHTIEMSKERYIGAWRSVNASQAQAGPEIFKFFLEYVEDRIHTMDTIPVVYKTRSWTVQKK